MGSLGLILFCLGLHKQTLGGETMIGTPIAFYLSNVVRALMKVWVFELEP